MSGIGLFGKLPSKGDFVSRGLSPEFLAAFEPWLAAIVQEARDLLGGDWQAIYDTAPIWRFWIGPETGLRACAGVLAASRDRVGRRYPLVLLVDGGDGSALPLPPLADAQDHWFAALEAALARADDPGFAEDPAALVADLDPPAKFYAPIHLGEAHQAFWAMGPAREVTTEPADPKPASPQPTVPVSRKVADPAPQAEAAEEWTLSFDEDDEDDSSPFDSSGTLALQPATAPLAPFAVAPDDMTQPEPAPEQAATSETGAASEAEPITASFQRDPNEIAALLGEVARTEIQLIAAARSYWWTAGDAATPAAFLAFSGLPNAAAFAAMLGGLRSVALASPQQ